MVQKKDVGKVEVPLPDNVALTVEGRKVTVTGQKGSISRAFENPHVSIVKKEKLLTLSTKSNRKKDVALLGTIRAHIKNMMKGVNNGVTYEMKIVYSHFPMSAKVSGNTVSIENFLGEKSPRYAPIKEGVTVKVSGQNVSVSGIDVEAVSQTAANIEQATKIKRLDPRVFQDGIYIIAKGGKLIK